MQIKLHKKEEMQIQMHAQQSLSRIDIVYSFKYRSLQKSVVFSEAFSCEDILRKMFARCSQRCLQTSVSRVFDGIIRQMFARKFQKQVWICLQRTFCQMFADFYRPVSDGCLKMFSHKCLQRCSQRNVCQMFAEKCLHRCLSDVWICFPDGWKCLQMFADKYFPDVWGSLQRNVCRCLPTNVCQMFEGKLTITTTFISIVAPSYWTNLIKRSPVEKR